MKEADWQKYDVTPGIQVVSSNDAFGKKDNRQPARTSVTTIRQEYLAKMQSRFTSGTGYCLVDNPPSELTIKNCAARVEDYWDLIDRTPAQATSFETPMDALNSALDSVLIHEVSRPLLLWKTRGMTFQQLSHAYYCGKTGDFTGGGASHPYGWKNACLMKRQDNAGKPPV